MISLFNANQLANLTQSWKDGVSLDQATIQELEMEKSRLEAIGNPTEQERRNLQHVTNLLPSQNSNH